jgi:hypothetical protein
LDSNKVNYPEISLTITSSSFLTEGNVGQGKRKNEGEAGVHTPLKKTKARVAIDGSSGEFPIVVRESSKVDNLHRALICSVKPLASIVVEGRDHVGAVAAGPVRRKLVPAVRNTVLKEANDLKRVADRLKV